MAGYGITPCCQPVANYPRPSSFHDAGRSHRVSGPNDRQASRRPTFFSRRAHRASYLLQHPTHVTMREMTAILFTGFALYRAFAAGADLRHLLTRVPVTAVCPRPGQAGLSCLYGYLWAVVWVLMGWGKEVVPWALIAVVVTFFGEEILGRLGGRK